MSLGTEWVIDASGCNPERLAEIGQLKLVFDRIIRDLELHVLGRNLLASVPFSRRYNGTRVAFRVTSYLPHLS